jgi:hypothetical protein
VRHEVTLCKQAALREERWMRVVSDLCPGLFPRSHASLVTAGCEAERKSPRAVRAIGLQQVKGKTGRANVSEPLMTPR